MTRPFIPIVDELQQILDVDKPGDLPKAVQELQKEVEVRQQKLVKIRAETIATMEKLATLYSKGE
jgi:hypothetical protein